MEKERFRETPVCEDDLEEEKKRIEEDDEEAIQPLGLEIPRPSSAPPGTSPGIETYQLFQAPGQEGPCSVTCIDYSPDQYQRLDVEDVDEFIAGHRPPWSSVRWINVDGLTDHSVIRALAEKYELHPLALEDMLCVPQRPKVEAYTEESGLRPRLFIVARMIQLIEGKLHSEQISMFLGHKTVLTFQETRGDVWDPIRQRIAQAGSRIRVNDPSYLIYTLLDAVLDQCFPILEHYGDQLEEMEERILENPDRQTSHEIHHLKRELLILRRTIWPMRTVINTLMREQSELLSETTRMYLRDVSDNTVQLIDLIETYHEVATALTETHMTAMSTRLNEVMKVLTIIGTIFIPLTFLAGVYGMNMPIPENQSNLTYPIFWTICTSIAVGMLLWFKKRGWI
ncbi:MAG: magnesium/cobalt transporter CorA [bacterium]